MIIKKEEGKRKAKRVSLARETHVWRKRVYKHLALFELESTQLLLDIIE